MTKLSLDRARAAWAATQGLRARADLPLDPIVARTGWIRTLGGADAYLALLARAEGLTIDRVHDAVATGALQVLPAVRGCIYLVPREDASIALQIAASLSAARTARDLQKVGVEDDELDHLGEAVLAALADGPLETPALRKKLPDGAVRSLGDTGKKLGLSSTLPPTLRRLEFMGRIVRRPVGHRLDSERYAWGIPSEDPLASGPLEPAALHRALAERFFAWAGPATLASFVAWSGLGKRDATAATRAAGLVPVEVETVGACLASEATLDAGDPGDEVRLLPALDNLVALPERPTAMVDSADHAVEIHTFGGSPTGRLGDAKNVFDRVLAHRGRIAGLWGWDATREDVVVHAFRGAVTVPDGERLAVRDLLRALGTGRRHSLDRDDTMTARAAELAAM